MECVQNTKYPRITIDEHLSWEPHICANVAKSHWQLASLGRNLRSCPQSLCKTTYKTIACPAIEYASPIWHPSSDWEIRWLATVQRHAARFVTGNSWKQHIDHLPQWDYGYVSVTQLIEDLGMAQSCGQASGRKWQFLKTLFPTQFRPGARPTKHISIEFEIRWKFKTI